MREIIFDGEQEWWGNDDDADDADGAVVTYGVIVSFFFRWCGRFFSLVAVAVAVSLLELLLVVVIF